MDNEKPEKSIPDTEKPKAAKSSTSSLSHEPLEQSEALTSELSNGKQQSKLLKLRGRLKQLCHDYWAKRWFTIPATILVLLTLSAVLPLSRYALLGLFVKRDLTVIVVDSQTDTPVSKVSVMIGKKSAMTDATGMVHIRTNAGYQLLNVSKQYYRNYTHNQLVTLSESQDNLHIKLVAVGRVVPVTVTNKLTGKPVANATIKALGTEAVTARDGTTTIVLPVAAATQQATITSNGYNTLQQNLTVTSQKVSVNTFALTPIGKLYFLSNLSGKIDVVKTDLDGSNRQTVLAGTGYEDPTDTVLLASRDWKYLALYTQRKASGNPEIDLIDTSTDTMSNIDEGNATFINVGWSGNYFIYQVHRNSVSDWQSGQEVLKSFNASTKSITLLAQTTASGSAQYDWLKQDMSNTYIVGSKVIYSIGWQASYYHFADIPSKQASLDSVNPNGSDNIVVKTFSLPSSTQSVDIDLGIVPYDGPNSLAINLFSQYYEYQNGQVSSTSDITSQDFYSENYPTYLLSPSGSKTFWSQYADGKNNLKVGDQNGQNAKEVATESDYSPYGWYTDNYLLVQKSGSELYIMPSDGSGQPIKISNYYKPQVSYRGYGGGYGGL